MVARTIGLLIKARYAAAGLGAAACIHMQGSSVSFIKCTFEACDVVADGGADAAFEGCSFLYSAAAISATGSDTRVSLIACNFSECSEALFVSTGARVHASECAIQDCRDNGMHIDTHSHLSLHACVVLGAAGYGLWAGATSVAKLSCTDIHACAIGSLCICVGAHMSISDGCNFD
jgi:hypothetical protein